MSADLCGACETNGCEGCSLAGPDEEEETMRRTMAKRRRGVHETTITYTLEVDVEVDVSVTPGEEPTGPTYDCGGTPGSDPEVEISAVRYGTIPLDVSNLTRGDIEALTERAIEAASEADLAAEEDHAEYMAEMRREREHEERGR